MLITTSIIFYIVVLSVVTYIVIQDENINNKVKEETSDDINTVSEVDYQTKHVIDDLKRSK